MAFNIGINVVETEGTAAPAIAGAPTSVAGLLLRSKRGPTDVAVQVTSFQQFVARFGAHDPGYAGAYAVEGFFLNGGAEAHIARVTGAGAAAASVTLKDNAGKDGLSVTAGYCGAADVGAWGNDLRVGVAENPEFSTALAATIAGNQPARLQGAALPRTVDLSTGKHSLALKIDGATTAQTITLDKTTVPVPSAVTTDDLAAAINAAAGRSVIASSANGGVLLVSRTKGATSKIEVAAGVDDATRTLLGFGTASTASGTASANASYTQVQVNGIGGFRVGQWVRLDDGITRDFRQITGVVQQTDTGGNLEYFVQFAEPSAAERNEYRIEDGATLATLEIDLVISRQADTDPLPQVVETWEKLSLDPKSGSYAPLRVNDPYTGSSYVLLADPNAASFSGRTVPAPVTGVRLGVATPSTSTLTRTKGNDGSDPASTDYRSAFSRFDAIAIQLLAVPEIMPDGILRAVTRTGLDYCVGPDKGDCMFVGHTPAGRDVAGAKAFGQDFRASKVYGALYWPWITVIDPVGAGATPTRVIPPTGHVLGIYARVDQTRGVWKAPAGNEATVRGALAVERDVTDVDHTDLVKNGSINGVRNIRGTGIVVDASRTLSTDTRWLYVNVRLLFNYVKASLREGLRWVKQEPNRDTLWNMIKFNTVIPFLRRLHSEGAFGTGSPDQVFTVICGPENNPPQQVMLGNLYVEVYFYPSRPAETIIITVGQQEGRSSASEG